MAEKERSAVQKPPSNCNHAGGGQHGQHRYGDLLMGLQNPCSRFDSSVPRSTFLALLLGLCSLKARLARGLKTPLSPAESRLVLQGLQPGLQL